MSGQEQKSTKLSSDLKRSQSTPRNWPRTEPIKKRSRGKASTSAERIRVMQGIMEMAGGSEHVNANEFLNNISSERNRMLAMSTHTPQTPTALEMPTTSFAAQNTPAAETETGGTYIGSVRNTYISSMSMNTAATAGSDAAAITDADAKVTVASEAAALIDENTEAPKAQSSTGYSFPGSALGSKSTANVNGIQKDAKTEEANNGEQAVDDSIYQCNICLDTAKDAVVSLCGHLFCWSCINLWIQTRPNCKLCPVCKGAIGKDQVIPVYGHESTKQEDPRNKVPPNPAGQRSEPQPQQGFRGFELGDVIQIMFGIGVFPFSYLALWLNILRAAGGNRGTIQFEYEDLLSKLFLFFGFLWIAWLLWFA